MTTTSKLGFPSILFFIFLVLKLTDTISWSWWWVTSPLWIYAIVWIVLVWLAIKKA
jgi:hypothetical protein